MIPDHLTENNSDGSVLLLFNLQPLLLSGGGTEGGLDEVHVEGGGALEELTEVRHGMGVACQPQGEGRWLWWPGHLQWKQGVKIIE